MSEEREKKALAVALWGTDALPLPDSEQRTLERLYAKGLRVFEPGSAITGQPLFPDIVSDVCGGLANAVEHFIRARAPEHTGPYCRLHPQNVIVASDKWTVAGAQDHCSLCLMNRALELATGEERQQIV